MSTKDQQCLDHTIKIIGNKWTIFILQELCHGTKRFNELAHALPNISPKTLSLRLKQLESYGIVEKKVFVQVPLRVEYSLTKKGTSLKIIINQMRDWGKERG